MTLQLGNFVKDDVIYTLCPRDGTGQHGQQWQHASAGDDVIIGGSLYRVAAVDSHLQFTFDLTGKPDMH